MGGFGYYGKIPTQGDFLRRGLSPAFVEPWDRWLQELLLSGRETLGAGWQDAYFSAPIWRFALPKGLCGGAAVAGVVMPSVDRVGRQFPLTLAAEAETGSAWEAYCAAEGVFAALEDAALAMLEEDASREGLERRLEALRLGPAPAPIRVLRAGGAAWLSAARGSLGALLAAGAAGAEGASTTLWASELAEGVRAMVSPGLPAGAEALRGLVDLDAPVWAGGAEATTTGGLRT